MKYVSALAVLLGLLAVNPAAMAAPDSKAYKIDPSHTRVLFFVDHFGLVKMPGHAQGISGQIDFNFKAVEASKVDLTIDAKKLGMDFQPLDDKLQGKEFFNTDQFPTMTFKSTKIVKTGVESARMTGDFTLLGVTRPVTLEVKFNGRKWNKYMGLESAGFSATGQLRRSDFGMKSYLPDIGDVVPLSIIVEADEIRPEAAIPHGK